MQVPLATPPASTVSMLVPFPQMPQQEYRPPSDDPATSAIQSLAPPVPLLDGHGVEAQIAHPFHIGGFELEENFGYLMDWTGMDSGVDLASSGPPSASPAPTPDADVGSMRGQKKKVHDCEARAFTTLHSLHYCTMIHSESPATATPGLPSFGQVSNRMPPLDKVLYFNRVAISTMKELLQCQCAQHPHLALLYMAIILKTLFWYRLAVNPQYETMSLPESMCNPDGPPSGTGTPDANSLASAEMPPVPPNMVARNVTATTIQIGIFDLEEEDEKLLMRSVLLREVKKVQSVVDEMKTLNAAQGRDEFGDEEHHSSSWYATGGARLEEEVNDTLKKVKEMGARKCIEH